MVVHANDGTLQPKQPEVVDIVVRVAGIDADELLILAAAAERRSEHALAKRN